MYLNITINRTLKYTHLVHSNSDLLSHSCVQYEYTITNFNKIEEKKYEHWLRGSVLYGEDWGGLGVGVCELKGKNTCPDSI